MYIYIKESCKNEDLVKEKKDDSKIKKIIIKIKLFIIKKINIIIINKINDNNYLFVIPIASKRKIYKIISKYKKRNVQIIISKYLENKIEIKSYKRKFIKYFILEIIKFIIKKIGANIEEQNLYIMVNDYNEENLCIIKYLLNNVKTVNIITNDLNRYNVFAENLYRENGLVISVSNNKNKGLKNAKFIINMDFDNRQILEYKINPLSCFINCVNEDINMPKYFQGMVVNNLNIVLTSNNEKEKEVNSLYNEFDKLQVFNNIEVDSYRYDDYLKKIKENKVRVLNLIGTNGIIDEKEIKNMKKILTNH